jgi:hypothetical protein
MTDLKSFVKTNERSSDSVEESKDLFTYSTVLSISMIAVSAMLLLGNLAHLLAFRADSDATVYNKYAQVNLLFFNFNLETVDKATWMISLMIGSGVLVIGSTQKWHLWLSRWSSNRLFLAGVFIMSASVLIESPLNDDLVGILWFGFGDRVFLASVIAMPIIYYLNLKDSESNWLVVAQYFLASFFVFNYLPSLLQPLWAIKDPWHSAYVFNEVLAPHNDQIPTSNFAAQYTNLSGFVFESIFRFIPNKSQLFMWHAASVYMTLLVLLTFYLLFVIARKITSRRISSLIALIVPAFTLVTPNGAGSGLITQLFSAVPIRVLPLYFVCLLLIRDHFLRRHVFLLGVVASFAAINNLDFGIPIFLATALVMFIHPIILIYRRVNMYMFCLGVGVTLISYVCLLRVFSGSFKADYWLLFAGSFGKGFGSVPMPLGGSHVLFLGLFCASIAIGAMKTKYLLDYITYVERRSAVVSLFFGLVGLGAFPYFVNRSVVSGQLQIFLFLAGPILCATFSIVRVNFKLLRRPLYLLASALILFPQALLIGSFMQRPDGTTEWKRVLNFGSNPYSERSKVISSAVAFAEETLNRDISLAFVSQGNLHLLGLNLKNVSLISEISDVHYIGGALKKDFCLFLDQSINDADALIFAELFFDENGSHICNGYIEVLALGDGFSIIKQD